MSSSSAPLKKQDSALPWAPSTEPFPSRLQIGTHAVPNRLSGDFLPPPNSSNPLVCQALTAFALPARVVQGQGEVYVKDEPRKPKRLEYLVDKGEEGGDGDGDGGGDGGGGGGAAAAAGGGGAGAVLAPRTSLTDLFVDPTAKPDADAKPAAAAMTSPQKQHMRNTSVTVDAASLQEADLEHAIAARQAALGKSFHREGVFWRYNPSFEPKESAEVRICKRRPTALWEPERGQEFLMSVDALAFHISDLEPFFCTAVLYDLRRGMRVSEYFHFDLNDPKVLTGEMAVARGHAQPATLSRHAVFSVTDRHEDVYLVVRVERVLQGDNEVADHYIKDKQRSEGELRKIGARTRETINRLHRYRQPFAWGAHKLFKRSGELRRSGTAVIEPLFFQRYSVSDAEMVEQLAELVQAGLDHTALRSVRALPNSRFTFDLRELSPDAHPRNMIDPSSILLKETEESVPLPFTPPGNSPVVKEVLEFVPDDVKPLRPHAQFINLLYAYPERVQFAKYRNIAVQVQFRNSDGAVQQDGANIILGKSSSDAFMHSYVTQVNYHNKSPSLQDEIKIVVPLDLTPRAHLFFTFYQVSCKKKAANTQTEEVIGYSVLPLYPAVRPEETRANPGLGGASFIANAVYELPIAEEIPNGYLQAFAAAVDGTRLSHGVKMYPQGKASFSVRTELVSSLFCQDRQLSSFFSTFPSDEELKSSGSRFSNQLLKRSVGCLVHADERELVQFLPPLCNYLTELIATRTQAAYQAFVGLCVVAHKISAVCNETGMQRCGLLATYVDHRFDNIEQVPLYLPLLKQWLRALREVYGDDDDLGGGNAAPGGGSGGMGEAGVPMRRSSTINTMPLHEEQTAPIFRSACIRYNWFFLELIFKSMRLDMDANGGKLSRREETLETLSECIGYFVQVVCDHRENLIGAKSLVTNLALFFTDLLYVLDRPAVDQLMAEFILEFCATHTTDPVLVELTFSFFEVIFDHNDIVEALNPFSFQPEAAGEDGIMQTVANEFPLVALFVKAFETFIDFNQKKVQLTAVDAMRSVLTKIDYDSRFHKATLKTPVSNMFLPLLDVVLSRREVISAIQKDTTRRSVLACFLWVLKFADTHLLRFWIEDFTTDELAGLFELLTMATREFAYHGYQHRRSNHDFVSILSPESFADANGAAKDLRSQLSQIESLVSGVGNRAVAGAAHNKSAGRASISITGGVKGGTLRAKRASVALGALGGISKGGTAGRSTLREMRRAMRRGQQAQAAPAANSNTLTMNSREFLHTLLRQEAGLSTLVSRVCHGVVLDIAALSMAGEDLLDPKRHRGMVAGAVFDLVVTLLELHQPLRFYHGFFPTVHYLIHVYGVGVFLSPRLKAHVNALAAALLHHCTLPDKEQRSSALVLLYVLLKTNFEAHDSLDYLQVSLTVALAKMAPQLKPKQAALLQGAFDALPSYFVEDVAWQADEEDATKFKGELDVLLGRMSLILDGQMEITRQKNLGEKAADPAYTELLLIKIADAFSHMRDNRVEWLRQLAEHHVNCGNLAEAAYCYVQIAEAESSNAPGAGGRLTSMTAIARSSSRSLGKLRTLSGSNLSLPELNAVVAGAEEELAAENYEKACKLLDQAKLYEQCQNTYKALTAIYERQHDYQKLSMAYMHLHLVCGKLANKNESDVRMLGTYYRVGFYGKKFGRHLDGREFVYKMPKITRLAEISSDLRQLYKQQIGADVRVLPDSGPVDRARLDPDECVMQITFVSPYFDADELALRTSFIDRNTRLHQFTFSTPFTAGGKAQGSITEQHKRVTIIEVENPFPCLRTRQPVVKRTETVLNPIQAAIEDVDLRTDRLETLLNNPPVDWKRLTALLKGSVSASVNGGAAQIAEAFLKPSPENEHFAPEDKERMRKGLRRFMHACQRALEVNKELTDIKASQSQVGAGGRSVEVEFHQVLEEGFMSLSSLVEPFLRKKKVVTAKKQARFAD